jgi:hypothetical protein
MPKRAKIYALTVIAAGTLFVACAAAFWICPSPLRFLACLCLALLGSTFKVKLPGMESCITPSFVPLLFASGTLSWQETAVMAAAAGITQTLWKAKDRPQLIQVAFNGANLAIAMGAAYAVSHAVAHNQILVELAAAVTVFEVVNTLFVSMVICLVTGSPLNSIWRNCHMWAFPFHLAGAALAAVWIQSDLAMSLSITFLGGLTLYLMSAFYKELVKRAGPVEA